MTSLGWFPTCSLLRRTFSHNLNLSYVLAAWIYKNLIDIVKSTARLSGKYTVPIYLPSKYTYNFPTVNIPYPCAIFITDEESTSVSPKAHSLFYGSLFICILWVLTNVKWYVWASLVAQLSKNPPAMQETPVWFLGQEDPREKGQATHSSILGLPWCLSW